MSGNLGNLSNSKEIYKWPKGVLVAEDALRHQHLDCHSDRWVMDLLSWDHSSLFPFPFLHLCLCLFTSVL